MVSVDAGARTGTTLTVMGKGAVVGVAAATDDDKMYTLLRNFGAAWWI